MNNLGYAIELAASVHRNQLDKSGEPYILHPLAVMTMVLPIGVDAGITGVLHDTFEDHPGTLKEQLAFKRTVSTSFSTEIYESLIALSHPPDASEPYDEYIERIAPYYLARIVKIADLHHNMDPNRIPIGDITEKDFRRWDKYRKALVRLERH